MPTAGPYGIEQFDAAGVIGAYQQGQQNRIRMMVEQKQLDKLDREEKTASGVQRAVSAYYGGGNTPAAASGGATTAPAASGAQPAASAPAAAPRPSAADREKLFGTLLALDPQVAGQYMDAFSKMDKSQIDRYKQISDRVAQFAGGLLQLPQAQRAAALQQAAPEAQELGYTPEHLAQVDLSDDGLRRIMVEHMDADKIAAFVKPEYHSITQGGSLLETAPAGESHTVYESPTVAGPGGEPFVRPPAMSTTMPTVSTPEEAAKLPPGTKFKLPDGRIGTVPGGAGGNASGGFPQ